jgi:hypothetical protein
MNPCRFITLVVPSAILVVAPPLMGQRAAKPDAAPFLIADRAAEVRLARTAAPPSISDSATVLVLERTGYVEAAHGTNGFTCVVIRSLAGNLEDPGLWSPRISAPHCFNAPAARSVMPTLLKQTAWLLSGESAPNVAAHVKRSYANRELPPPANGSMAYMLSPEQVLDANGLRGLPHLMFFYDKSRPASMWGADAAGSPVGHDATGDAHAPFMTLFIGVRRWSNGAPAGAAPDSTHSPH